MVKKQLLRFWKTFKNPGVILFVVLGTGIIFLTFLTDDNALEIVISGVASIFIGIGINNFSSLETRNKDAGIINRKVKHSLQVLDMMDLKFTVIQQNISNEDTEQLKNNLLELTNLIKLLRELLIEEETLK